MMTDKQIRSTIEDIRARGGERTLIDSTGSRGTGRLMLRVRGKPGARPAAEWIVRWKRAGEREQITIGRYPDLPLADARRQYDERRKVITAGGDPKAKGASGTVEQLFRAYVEATRKDCRASHAAEVERALLTAKGNPFAEALGKHKLAREITPGEIAQALAPVYRRAPAMAGHLRKYLAAAWSYGMRHDNDFRAASRSVRFGITSNPASALPTVPSVARDRVLAEAEVRRWWHEFPDAADERTVLVLRLTFLCCARVTEAIRALPEDIKPGRWTKRETKNEKPHASPLVGLGQQTADRLMEIGGGLMTHRAVAKAVLRWCRANGLEPWQPRDLRRTARTWLEEAAEDPALLDLAFNHNTTRAGVARNYVHADRWPDRVALAARWEAIIRGVVN